MQLRHAHSVWFILWGARRKVTGVRAAKQLERREDRYLLVAQDDHRKPRLHPQEAVQLSLSQWEAFPIGGVHHVNQNMSPPQVVQPVPPQVLPAAD